MDSTFGSDHFPLRIELRHINFEAYNNREKLNINKLDWPKFSNNMESKIPIIENLVGTPIEKYDFIKNEIQTTILDSGGEKSIGNRKQKHRLPPW